MALLEVRSLSKRFEPGKSAVDNVTLSVNQAEIVCLLGPSGCGKTTLLRSIAGLEIPDTGTVLFAGRDVAQVPPHKRDFGMMFQDFALFPHKNVYDNIAFGLQMRYETPENIHSRVHAMLELVDLVGYGEREIEQLSGGEQQRVALARALAPRPSLLMLDEPLGALDRALRERLMLDLREILKQVGVTAIYVTHDQTEAFAVADRVAVMNRGHIEQFDPPQIVFLHPASPFVARFLGFQNIMGGEVVNEEVVRTQVGDLKITSRLPEVATHVTLLVRPEAARILHSEEDGIVNELLVKLKLLSFRGKYYQVWVQVADQDLMFEISQVTERVGDSVRLSLNPAALELLPA